MSKETASSLPGGGLVLCGTAQWEVGWSGRRRGGLWNWTRSHELWSCVVRGVNVSRGRRRERAPGGRGARRDARMDSGEVHYSKIAALNETWSSGGDHSEKGASQIRVKGRGALGRVVPDWSPTLGRYTEEEILFLFIVVWLGGAGGRQTRRPASMSDWERWRSGRQRGASQGVVRGEPVHEGVLSF